MKRLWNRLGPQGFQLKNMMKMANLNFLTHVIYIGILEILILLPSPSVFITQEHQPLINLLLNIIIHLVVSYFKVFTKKISELSFWS